MSYYEDEIYHSGYLDGYYDSMELYHADDEMTEEERRARRRRRRRNIALGVGTTAGVAALGVGIAAADKRHSDKVHQMRQDELKNAADNLKSRMEPFRKKRNIHGFRKTAGTYKIPSTRTYVPTWALERSRKYPNKIQWRRT